LGEAYMDGFMNGEVVVGYEEGKCEVREWELR
jgi:hypothetical protein